ncbi:hypothetical protein DFH08DRAFT_1083741 [Mycena albidolilacea]|uniref:Uncharacterized protein n=1 Tax=Mycena albidolilacea TaxID=1033008 RepID=A0AAD6ZP42_9AGAR|nr:hypothetical protein DFH08DRAFT_1083741 [Mycena albidolilacea]
MLRFRRYVVALLYMPAVLIDLRQLVHPGTTAQYTQARLHRVVSCVVAPLLTLFLTALRILDWVSAALGHDSVLGMPSLLPTSTIVSLRGLPFLGRLLPFLQCLPPQSRCAWTTCSALFCVLSSTASTAGSTTSFKHAVLPPLSAST